MKILDEVNQYNPIAIVWDVITYTFTGQDRLGNEMGMMEANLKALSIVPLFKVGSLTSRGFSGIGFSGESSSIVLGTAQATGTRGHAFLSRAIGLRYSLDPSVARVTYDLGYKRLLGGGTFKYGPRPDVGVLFKSGRVKVFEIGSKTDNLFQLSNRNFMRQNGINGSIRVYSGARYLNKLWPK